MDSETLAVSVPLASGLLGIGVFLLFGVWGRGRKQTEPHVGEISAARLCQAARLRKRFKEDNEENSDPVDIQSLPDIIQKFVARSGARSGDFTVVKLTQRAEIRNVTLETEKAWMDLDCVQWNSLTTLGFFWEAVQRNSWGITVVRVVDALVEGAGLLRVKLLGLVQIASLKGPDADHGELLRNLAELPWHPDSVRLNPDLNYVEIKAENDSVHVVEISAFTRDGRLAAVRLHFTDEGDCIEMNADGRICTENGQQITRPWRGVFSQHTLIGGRRIPTKGEVGYLYIEKNNQYKAYWRGDVLSYELS